MAAEVVQVERVRLHISCSEILIFVKGEESSEFPDAPETPAPVFAIRAFKTALFGTPAPVIRNNRQQEPSPERKPILSDTVANYREEEDMEGKPTSESRVSTATSGHASNNASPAKGILLTPGTGTSRPKRVSFGGLGQGNGNRPGRITGRTRLQEITLEDLPDVPQVMESRESEQAGTGTSRGQVNSEKKPVEPIVDPEGKGQALLLDKKSAIDSKKPKPLKEEELDATIDLKNPISQSGRHWKREYTEYHEKSEDEMTRLIRKNKATRDYAMEKDQEALILKAKLEEALLQVAGMEAKVSELAARVFKGDQDGDGRTQEDLIAELASQTAKAVRYKRKADKYDLAIQEHRLTNSSHRSCGERTEANGLSESAAVGGQSAKLAALRAEVSRLNEVVERAESKAAKLEEDNMTLSNSINRVRRILKKYESRNINRRQSDERAKVQNQKLQVDLEQAREESRQQKSEIENLYGVIAALGSVTEQEVVKTLAGQVLKLQSELKVLRSISSKDQPDSQEKPVERERPKQEEPKSSNAESIDIWNDVVETTRPGNNFAAKPISTSRHSAINATTETNQDAQQPGLSMRDRSNAKGNRVDKLSRAKDKQAIEKQKACEIPQVYEKTGLRSKAPEAAIQQIDYQVDGLPIPPRFSRDLPKDLKVKESDQRRMSEAIARVHHPPIITGSRPGSMISNRSRVSLPPERIAAAKLRLAEKNAEKQRLMGRGGKENVRP